MTREQSLVILVADDDPDDRELIRESFSETGLANPVHFVRDGEELLEYLRRTGKFGHLAGVPLPVLVLLDLNMPRMDGREALQEMKRDPALKRIPVVVFTTSRRLEDIQQSYELGANSFISKPATFDSLLATVRRLTDYWLEIVELPACPG